MSSFCICLVCVCGGDRDRAKMKWKDRSESSTYETTRKIHSRGLEKCFGMRIIVLYRCLEAENRKWLPFRSTLTHHTSIVTVFRILSWVQVFPGLLQVSYLIYLCKMIKLYIYSTEATLNDNNKGVWMRVEGYIRYILCVINFWKCKTEFF